MFDLNDNGQIDTEAGYARSRFRSTHRDADGTETVTEGLTDTYFWQEADLYSGIHTINTDADDFNVDIDGDGAMDFFTMQDLIITLAENAPDNDAQGGAGDDTIHGNSEKNRLEGKAGMTD